MMIRYFCKTIEEVLIIFKLHNVAENDSIYTSVFKQQPKVPVILFYSKDSDRKSKSIITYCNSNGLNYWMKDCDQGCSSFENCNKHKTFDFRIIKLEKILKNK